MLRLVETEMEGEMLPTLDELAREGARRMLATALKAEAASYVEAYRHARDEKGHALVVRNGKARARPVTLGSGTVEIRAPRVNDRRHGPDGERLRFTSKILPPYMRRSPKVAEVLPVLYLRGLSTGDFREALPILLGERASGLSPTNIARMTAVWQEDYEAFQKRSLADRDYVYIWVDGIHVNVRLEEDRLCLLVVIGARPDGTKELIGITDGYRESTESWLDMLRDLKRRGMQAPVLAIGDGALGFWAALRDVWPQSREQRDWFIVIVMPGDRRGKNRIAAASRRTAHSPSRSSARRGKASRFSRVTLHSSAPGCPRTSAMKPPPCSATVMTLGIEQRRIRRMASTKAGERHSILPTSSIRKSSAPAGAASERRARASIAATSTP